MSIYEMDAHVFGRRVAAIRKATGWSARELAERPELRMSRSTLTKIETGVHASVAVNTVLRVAAALGVPPAVLAFGTDSEVARIVADRAAQREVGEVVLRPWLPDGLAGRAERALDVSPVVADLLRVIAELQADRHG